MGNSVAIDVRMIHSSGIGRYIRSLLSFIIRHNSFTVTLIGSRNDIKGYEWCQSENVRFIDCSAKIYGLREQLELANKIPSKCGLFWSPHYNIPLLPISAKKRIVTIHDVFHLAFWEKLSFKQKIYAKAMLNSAVRLSHKIITVSNFSKAEIVKHTGISQSKISVIHNAVNTEQFKPLDNSCLNVVKEKHELPDKFILFVGNLKPHKNLKRLLGAFTKLYQDGTRDYHLVIAGSNEDLITEDKEIYRIFNNNAMLKKKVIFFGYVENEDLPALYNLSSLFVFPSLYEGFGLSPLEAMACKCPTVVSNAASLPEICDDATYYVDPYSTEDIAKGMYNVLTNDKLRNIFIENGLERIKLFSWEKSAKEHITIFNGLFSS